MPESVVISGLVLGDIDRLKHVVSGLIDDFYKRYDPRISLDKSYIIGLVTDVHLCIDELACDLQSRLKEKKK